MWAAIRISELTESELEAIEANPALEEDMLVLERPFSVENEYRTARRMLKLINALFPSFPTTIEEDLKLFERDDLSENRRNAIKFRVYVKVIVRNTKDAVRRLWADLLTMRAQWE
jgi:intein/homing endonuclease